jgi:hypothetical protein
MRLTDRSVQALRSAIGHTVTGVLVAESSNRNLEDAPSVLGIALSNGSVLNLYPTSTTPKEDSPDEYFRLDIEPASAPLEMNYSAREPVKWSVATPLMRALVGTVIRNTEVIREEIDGWGAMDVGIRVVTSNSHCLCVRAEHDGLPMTLAVQLSSEALAK